MTPTIGCLFTMLLVSFAAQNLLIKCYVLPFADFCFCSEFVLLVLSPEIHCQIQCEGASSLHFLVTVSGLVFQSLIHFRWISVSAVKRAVWFLCSACVFSVLSAAFVKRLFLRWVFLVPCGILIDSICGSLILSSMFYCLGLCVCFYASGILFLLLCIHSSIQ